MLYIAGKIVWKICKSLREHRKNIIDFEKKKLLPLIKEEEISHQDASNFYICGKSIYIKDHIQVNVHTQHVLFVTQNLKCPQKIPVVIHNGSNYDYHFTIKNWQMSLRDDSNVFGKIQKKYKKFSLPVENEVIQSNHILQNKGLWY